MNKDYEAALSLLKVMAYMMTVGLTVSYIVGYAVIEILPVWTVYMFAGIGLITSAILLVMFFSLLALMKVSK